MQEAVTSPYLVPFDGTFRLAGAPTLPPEGEAREKKRNRKLLKDLVERISDLQQILWAHDHHAVLLVFQAMDAAGKDGTIRAVLSGVNPAGCRVSSFKAPSNEELEHDFLWRTTRRLPERGQIGVFNRSYYEEVLVVRVHPHFLEGQRLVRDVPHARLWAERYESILEHERHLARNGTLVLKFFLHLSREEQRRRFLDRLEDPDKRWKFRVGDVEERGRWDDYMHAYQEALAATSRPWAPWYAIPADYKPFMRTTVADIVVRSLEGLDLRYPQPRDDDVARFAEMRRLLEAEAG